MASFQRIRTEFNRGVLRVVLARPEVRNAFDVQTMAELTQVFSTAGTKGEFTTARAVLLSGEGKSFCAGADLEYMKSMAVFSRDENKQDAEKLFAMFDSVRTCAVPVIVHAHGHAMGGAVGITACADIAFAEKGTLFRFSEVRLGIAPAVISSFVLSKMNPLWARRWMMTGEMFDADQALEAGLLHFVGSTDEVEKQSDAVIAAILEAAPEAVKVTKRLVNDVGFSKPGDVRLRAVELIAERRTSAEGQEGLSSFFEKREPNWRAKP